MKYDKSLFERIYVDNTTIPSISASVDNSLGIIKINFKHDIKLSDFNLSDSNNKLFDLVFVPTGLTNPQKVNITLSDESYYITSSGKKCKPKYEYNDIKLISKNY